MDLFSQAEHDEDASRSCVAGCSLLGCGRGQPENKLLAALQRAGHVRISLGKIGRADQGSIALSTPAKYSKTVSPQSTWKLSVPRILMRCLPSIRHAGAIFMGRIYPRSPWATTAPAPITLLPHLPTAALLGPPLARCTDFSEALLGIFCSPEGHQELGKNCIVLARRWKGLTAPRALALISYKTWMAGKAKAGSWNNPIHAFGIVFASSFLASGLQLLAV